MRAEQNSRAKDDKEPKKFDKNLLLLNYVQVRKGAYKRSRFQDWAGSMTSVNPKKWENLSTRILHRYKRTHPEMTSAFLHFKKKSIMETRIYENRKIVENFYLTEKNLQAKEANGEKDKMGAGAMPGYLRVFIDLSTREIENAGGIRERLRVVEEHMDEAYKLASNRDGGLKSLIKLVSRDKKKRRSKTKKTPDIDQTSGRQSLASRYKASILNLLQGSRADNYPERDQILAELIKQGVRRITTPKQLSHFIKRVNSLLKQEKSKSAILCVRGTNNKMGGYYLKSEEPHDNDCDWWRGRREPGDSYSKPIGIHTEEAILLRLTNEGMSLEKAAALIGITMKRANALRISIDIKMTTAKK